MFHWFGIPIREPSDSVAEVAARTAKFTCRCGRVVPDAIESLIDAGFAPRCSVDCHGAPPAGLMKTLPASWKDR